MSIEFKKIRSHVRLINPFKNNTLDEIPFEIRFDPLTRQTGRVFDLPFKAEKPNVADIVERSKKIFCPFCPETIEKSTPEFPRDFIPEGRIRVGEASLIPNLAPFEKYAGVAILSPEHFIPMEALSPEKIHDAFSASLVFLKKVAGFDPLVHFFSINWNYMPPAGSSIVHAHLQPNGGEVPTNEQRLQVEGCRKYKLETGRDFWDDYIEAERGKGERYLAEIGPGFWSLNFVPFSFLPDVKCIFPKRRTLLHFEDDDIYCFLDGLSKVLQFFVNENVYSFNVSIFSCKDEETHCVNARVCPRLLPRAIGNSDMACPQMTHKESFTVRPPEAVCPRMKEFFSR